MTCVRELQDSSSLTCDRAIAKEPKPQELLRAMRSRINDYPSQLIMGMDLDGLRRGTFSVAHDGMRASRAVLGFGSRPPRINGFIGHSPRDSGGPDILFWLWILAALRTGLRAVLATSAISTSPQWMSDQPV
ncbi:hypothetical protein GJ744_001041 [Endocarpon pusillum]|uniref:Uncharacterized protein n=1 Tax=Endocarpon pusillum TaxID=364733 RepID=A0A8H7AA50_9EURO|nr:hypothetical protein GJ744_001041 [Endocarpon pusillum]